MTATMLPMDAIMQLVTEALDRPSLAEDRLLQIEELLDDDKGPCPVCTRPRKRKPMTVVERDRKIAPNTEPHLLLVAFETRGELTDREAGEVTSIKTFNQRCGELRKDGYLAWTGMKVPCKVSGSKAGTSFITPKGVAKLIDIEHLMQSNVAVV